MRANASHWRREGLKVPQKQPKRGCLWLNDGSCIRLRAERPDHVWSYDFVGDRTHEGKKFRMLNIIDEFNARKDGAALLEAFDRHRERICKVASRAYAKRREGSYTLTAADFS